VAGVGELLDGVPADDARRSGDGDVHIGLTEQLGRS
jgi:hypothetical protein